ncbi:MAG: hypothetical protein J7J07_05840 [Syntrophobacterales bacterium]|nr:hypothetical protein [Syntrophobacterales bacterium]
MIFLLWVLFAVGVVSIIGGLGLIILDDIDHNRKTRRVYGCAVKGDQDDC